MLSALVTFIESVLNNEGQAASDQTIRTRLALSGNVSWHTLRAISMLSHGARLYLKLAHAG